MRAVFDRFRTGIVGFNSTPIMDDCVILSCVCTGLATADPPSKESYPACKRIHSFKMNSESNRAKTLIRHR
jgi:hypothetical protein